MTRRTSTASASGARSVPDLLALVDRACRDGRPQDGAVLCEAALADDPRRHALHNARAVASRAAGDPRVVGRSYARAIALAPAEPAYYINLANALVALDRPARGRRLVLNALRLRRDHPGYRLMLAECLLREGRYGEAEAVLAPLASARPFDAVVLYTAGNLSLSRGDAAPARRALLRCLALSPGDARACMNLASASRSLGDDATAILLYEATLARAPYLHAASYMRACTLLANGRLAEGWDGYESRWQYGEFPATRRRTERPAWDGTPRPGSTLLVWPEQGVGDELFYASCVPDLLRTGQDVILECDARLVPLFRSSFPEATVRAVTHDRHGRERLGAPDYDFQLPIASLPRLFRRSLDAFPKHEGYLHPPREALERWRDAVSTLESGLKVGISWRSGLMTGGRPAHFAPIAAWQPVLDIPGIIFVNLQYGTLPAERAAFAERLGRPLVEWPELNLKDDFANVAALIRALDLVISGPACASIQAASLGHPVWVVDGPPSYFRYHGTGAMPWMPSWRPFTKRDWTEPWDRVFVEMAAALRARAAIPTG